MAVAISSSSVEVGIIAGQLEAQADPSLMRLRPDQDDPFRVLILGDFTGRRTHWRKPIRVDRDNLDEVLAMLHLHLDLKLGNEYPTTVPIKLQSLEDFEPDQIFAQCDLFRGLEQTAPTVSDAEKAMGAQTPHGSSLPLTEWTSGSLLDDIVERSEPQSPRRSERRQGDDLDSLVERIAAPHLTKSEAAANVKKRAERMSVLMRAIMHHRDFQALEAAWRSVAFLLKRLETDERLKVYIFDVSKQDLTEELLESEDFRASALYEMVVADTLEDPDAEPWALLVGNYGFDRNDEQDMQLLERIGLLARAAGAPFLAECVPSKQERRNAIQFWNELRKSSHAGYLGLAVPRVLLRLPYGAETKPIASFAFEEMPQPLHTNYLWGNPAFVCALLLANEFCRHGWNFAPGGTQEVTDLPVHTYKTEAGPGLQPSAEVLLTERDCAQLSKEGLMAVAAAKNRDSVRVRSFQSIAEPHAPLSGRWGD